MWTLFMDLNDWYGRIIFRIENEIRKYLGHPYSGAKTVYPGGVSEQVDEKVTNSLQQVVEL